MGTSIKLGAPSSGSPTSAGGSRSRPWLFPALGALLALALLALVLWGQSRSTVTRATAPAGASPSTGMDEGQLPPPQVK